MALWLNLAAGYQTGKTQRTPAGKRNAQLSIWVENWAHVSTVTLAGAEKVATVVFQKAGIDVGWRVVSFLKEPPPAASLVRQPAANIVVRINQSQDMGYPQPSLGFRWQRGPGDVRAIVFIDRVEGFARRHHVSSGTPTLVGCAVAHEIGHLLLGAAHSSTGIMRAEWNSHDAWLATHGILEFSHEQAKKMREQISEIVRRLTQ
jgi:hypothetical protein